MKNTEVFDNGLVVRHRKSAVILELVNDSDEYRFAFPFNPTGELAQYLEEVAKEVWPAHTPKLATSDGADYWEYYDSTLDSNGYLTMYADKLCIGRPSLDSKRIYQFNKRRMESFLYDLNIVKERGYL